MKTTFVSFLGLVAVLTGSAQTLRYDDSGRLLSALYSSGQGVSYSYDRAGNILNITPLSVATIAAQPASQTVTAGSSVTLRVTATSASPLSYQWQRNGSSLSGATSATLSLSNVRSGDAGSYTVVLTNDLGTILSAAAILSVNDVPRGPASATIVPLAGSFGLTLTPGSVQPAAGPADDFFGVAYGNGRFVAVGESGVILAFEDGATNWSACSSGSSTWLLGVTFGGDQFVAVGDRGLVLTSPDGLTWTARTTGITTRLNGVVFGAGTYVAVGENGVVLTSADGTTWTRRTSGVTGWLRGIAWTGTGFVVTGEGGAILRSTNGVAWAADASLVTLGLDAGLDNFAGGENGFLLVRDSTGRWQREDAGLSGTWIHGLAFASAENGILAVGDLGTVRRRLPNGEWSTVGTAPRAMFAIVVRPASGDSAPQSWVAVGMDGAILGGTVSRSGAGSARLINLSILTSVTADAPSFKMGTVLGGTGTSGRKPVVIRAAGPSLGALGVSGVLSDPTIQVFGAGSAVVAANDNWGGGTALAAAMAQVGAFPFANAGSRDAAIAPDFVPGDYVIEIGGVSGATGTVIAELYDATPAAAVSAATPRLINVSVLKKINAGEMLTAGFVIAGPTTKQVLIRAIGPSLAAFGVAGPMADPKLVLFGGSTQIATNDNWGGDGNLSAVGNAVGAFRLSTATSKDAMLLATLQAGSYTAQVSAADGAAGMVLIEVYEVP